MVTQLKYFVLILVLAGCDMIGVSSINRGDVNEDGIVNCADAVIILGDLDGLVDYQIPRRLWTVADADGNGTIEAKDAYLICPTLR